MKKLRGTVSKPTPEEQLLALKRVNRVSEADWQKITELATSLSPGSTLEIIRELVLCRRLLLMPPPPRGPDKRGHDAKQRAERIVKACEALLNDVNPASGVASVFEHPESPDAANWLEFIHYLEKLLHRARKISAPVKLPAHNVDAKRDLVWTKLISLYERTMGKPARVSNSADGTAASGKIVHFIQAFSLLVPGLSIPAANEIRGVERKTRDARKLVASKLA